MILGSIREPSPASRYLSIRPLGQYTQRNSPLAGEDHNILLGHTPHRCHFPYHHIHPFWLSSPGRDHRIEVSGHYLHRRLLGRSSWLGLRGPPFPWQQRMSFWNLPSWNLSFLHLIHCPQESRWLLDRPAHRLYVLRGGSSRRHLDHVLAVWDLANAFCAGDHMIRCVLRIPGGANKIYCKGCRWRSWVQTALTRSIRVSLAITDMAEIYDWLP